MCICKCIHIYTIFSASLIMTKEQKVKWARCDTVRSLFDRLGGGNENILIEQNMKKQSHFTEREFKKCCL